MTGYHITVAYLSGYDRGEAWQVLKRTTLELCHNWQRIAQEAQRHGMAGNVAAEYAMAYKDAGDATRGTEDSTLMIIGAKDDEPPQIMQLADGEGSSRTIKEAMRRAFCRLVMEDMHRLGIEININVA